MDTDFRLFIWQAIAAIRSDVEGPQNDTARLDFLCHPVSPFRVRPGNQCKYRVDDGGELWGESDDLRDAIDTAIEVACEHDLWRKPDGV